MDIRRLQTSDAAVYRALRLRALREHPEAFTSSFEEDSQEPVATSQKRLQGNVKMWGAFDGDALVGLVGLDREARLKNRHKAVVVGMYVAPEAGRRGVGKALMQALLEEARADGIELLVLTVTAGNDGARDLYLRCGFKSFGVEPGAIKVEGRAYDKDHMALPLAVQAA